MVKALAWKRWDLGSNPRSPKIFVSIFLCIITYRFPKGYPPYTSIINAPSGLQSKSEGQDGMTTIVPGQCTCGRSKKVKEACSLLGHKLPEIPPKLGHHPPGLFFFLLFILLFLLLIIIIIT